MTKNYAKILYGAGIGAAAGSAAGATLATGYCAYTQTTASEVKAFNVLLFMACEASFGLIGTVAGGITGGLIGGIKEACVPLHIE